MMIRDEAGFTLPELLLAMVMFVIILLATLTVFDRTVNLSSANTKQNDSVEESRVAIDQVMRQLRNLASPTTPQSTIDTAGKYDLIFQTDDPNKTWVRYCLDSTGNGSTPSGILYYGFSASSSLSGSQKGPCPGTGWPSGNLKVVAQDVTNEQGGQDRPIFTYNCTPGSAADCPATSADNSKIVVTGVRLYIDTTPNKAPVEKQVASAVYLRNQNQPPTASFTATNQTGAPRTVIFNGSPSSDPEGRTLHYYWCDGAVTQCSTTSSNFMGPGVTLTYTFADTNQHQIVLTVVDPGGLATTIQQSITPSNR